MGMGLVGSGVMFKNKNPCCLLCIYANFDSKAQTLHFLDFGNFQKRTRKRGFSMDFMYLHKICVKSVQI